MIFLTISLSNLNFMAIFWYRFRKIIGKNNFPYHFKKIIVHYKKIVFYIDVLRQTACLIVNPIKANSFALPFWLHVVRAWTVGDWHLFLVVLGRGYHGLTDGFFLPRKFRVVISVSPHYRKHGFWPYSMSCIYRCSVARTGTISKYYLVQRFVF